MEKALKQDEARGAENINDNWTATVLLEIYIAGFETGSPSLMHEEQALNANTSLANDIRDSGSI
jgi:hypothetical protein